jgi:hypothetical protein
MTVKSYVLCGRFILGVEVDRQPRSRQRKEQGDACRCGKKGKITIMTASGEPALGLPASPGHDGC